MIGKKKYYIAYGSNLNTYQMSLRCPGAKPVGTAEIKDYRLLFKGSMTGAYLPIEPSKGHSVPVAVWAVNAAHEEALDRYEGFPSFYYKKEMRLPVTRLDGGKTETLTAFVYIMHEERQFALPSKYYVEGCLDGYRAFGFDENIISEAIRFSAEEASKCSL